MTPIKTSKFQFSNPKVKKIKFEVNEEFCSEQYKGMSVTYEITSDGMENNSSNMELSIQIGEKGTDTPFYIELSIFSQFSWTEDANMIVDKLLKKNAVTLLLSYARPIVAHLTTDAGYRPFNIPFADLREDFDKMDERV